MADAFIRGHNSHLRSFASPVTAIAPPDQRGIINEAGFLIFKRSVAVGVLDSFKQDSVTECLRTAFLRSEGLPKSTVPNLSTTLTLGRFEAIAIARNLCNYFLAQSDDLYVNPLFAGCGWVNDVEADILCGTTLYEVKAGDRQFRLSDLRQLLAYCALNFSSKKHIVQDVSLINPRSGAIIKESLDVLCMRLSGTSSVHVLGEIVSYISEPIAPYFSI